MNEFVKDTKHSLNCIFCHDPHGAQPRIIRDGLIQALTRPEKDTLWHKDPKAGKVDVKELGQRGFTRKIAILDKYDTKLQCGQCHVEYNCNPGTDPVAGKPVTMADQRTNHFPLKNVNDLAQHYRDLKFRDFKHAITGAMLWKAQHPDVEVYYGSVHDKEGAMCHTCHMPKEKDAKTGKTFTSHWQTSPKEYVQEACLGCHKTWSKEQAVYTVDSLKNRYMGKLRKAEYWLTRMIDKFEEAKNARRGRGDPQRGAREALRGARALGVLDGLQRLVLPQPEARRRVDQQGHGDLAGSHQDPRGRDGEEAHGRRRARAGTRPGPGRGAEVEASRVLGFWLVAGGMTARRAGLRAGAARLPAPRSPHAEPREANLAALRASWAELDRDLRRRAPPAAEHESARATSSRAAPPEELDEGPRPSRRRPAWAAAARGLRPHRPAAAFALYAAGRQPRRHRQRRAPSRASRAPHRRAPAGASATSSRSTSRGQPEGRPGLGAARPHRSLAMDRFAEAETAFERPCGDRKVALDADVWCDYADAAGLAQGGRSRAGPAALHRQGAGARRRAPAALEMAGSLAIERGDPARRRAPLAARSRPPRRRRSAPRPISPAPSPASERLAAPGDMTQR